jgi:hypothetical protein
MEEISMGYAVEEEIKRRARGAGLTARDLAAALGEPPSTTSNRLNGFAALSGEQRRIIWQAIKAAEAKISQQAGPANG